MQHIPLDHLIKDSPTAIAFFDTELNLMVHSPLWTSTFQLSANSLIGKSLSFMFPQATSEFKRQLNESLTGLSHHIRAQKIALNDGTIKWFDWRIDPIKDKSGVLKGLLITVINVTSRKKENDLMKMVKKVSKTGGWEICFIKNEFYWTSVTKDIFGVAQDYQPDMDTAVLFFKEGISRIPSKTQGKWP